MSKKINLETDSIESIREKLGGTKTLTISCQKGGVGKSTLTSDLGYSLAKKGFKVMLIDSDPQASLTALCNVDTVDDNILGLQDLYEYALENNGLIRYDDIRQVWENKAPCYSKAIRENGKYIKKDIPFGFDLIPTNINLANFDIELANNSRGGLMLYSIINSIKENAGYDFIILDTCPGLSTLAYNSITAGVDGVIIPVNLEPMTIKGAQNLINVTTEIQHLLYDNAKVVHKGILGIVKNQYAPRLNIQKRFSNIVETFFPIRCFTSTIPSKTSCDTAHDLGRVYSEYDPKVAQVYEELIEEIINLIIGRNDETEPIFVEEFGEEIWNMINEKKGSAD